MVEIYQINDEDGSETQLGYGSAGSFKLAPKRGSDTTQTVWLRTLNYDATEVTASKTYTVYVSGELTQEVRYLASDDYGSKIWKWDVDGYLYEGTPAAWGNMGYTPGKGDTFVNDYNGIWWACYPDDLVGQLNHSDTGIATGEESVDAYMTFDEDGYVKCFDADGNQIHSGHFSVSGYTGERNIPSVAGDVDDWALGYLTTDEGSILFPFQINACNYSSDGKGVAVTHYEIMQLDSDHMKLIYPYPADPDAEVTSWSEATWWAFKAK
ncbi:MAG: hypothetical protein LUC49_05750 [Prevotella sp.]|nr:hypothetical protein [Prevotella sp.]